MTPGKQFRPLLFDIAKQLTHEDFCNLKFLCEDDIPGGVLACIQTPRDLFDELIKEGKISEQDTRYLENFLTRIGRVDLKDKLQNIDYNSTTDVWPVAQKYGLKKEEHAYFIGRDALLDKITEVYMTGKKPMVAVVAPPGFGKTCVATHVGHAMKDKGYKVIYVDLRQETSCCSMCKNILKTMGLLSVMPFADDLTQKTKNLLKSLEHPTLLIIDNAEDIQNSSASQEFENFIEFLGSNAEKLKIFLGSRKNMFTMTMYFEQEPINLLPLDDEASLELLLTLSDGTSLRRDEAKELAIQCSGVPLLIKIARDLVKAGSDPTKLAENLRKHRYAALTSLTEHDLMKFLINSIQVFLDSLPRTKLVALVQLSCFPAQFTEDIVNEIFFENGVNELKCSGMLCSLHAGSLVQLDGKNYSLHPLIQTFCREEQERMKCKKEGEEAVEAFSDYYFDQLKRLHGLFVSKDGCQEALQQFLGTEMNLLQALENASKCNDDKMKKRCIDAFNASINFLGKVMRPGQCLSVYKQLYDEAEKMKDKKRMSECLVSLGFRHLCEVNHGEFSQDAFDAFKTALSLWGEAEDQKEQSEPYAHCCSKLGLCYIAKKETEKGQTLIDRAIPIREKLGDKVLLAASHCDKAIAACLCDNHAEAIEIFEKECLPVYKEYLGDHPWVASLLNYISKSHQDLGCLEKAIEYNKQALDIREKLLGRDHQDTARSYVRLGELFAEQENMEEALGAYRKAASIQDKVLGVHEETQKSYQAIEGILRKLDMDKESEEVRERVESYNTEIKEQRRFNRQISEDMKRKADQLTVRVSKPKQD